MVLRYRYVVADGDNGELTIEKMLGGELTDYTGKVKANTAQENNEYNSTQGEIQTKIENM